MASPGVKCSGGKILPRSDLRVGSASGDIIRRDENLNFRIGTWNVRTLRRDGKLENLLVEMDKCKVNIIGLSEVRWLDKGEIVSGKYTMFYSGGTTCERGVAIIMENKIVQSVNKVVCHSDRLMFVKISAEPVDILVIQVYMPTSDHDVKEVEKMYDEIEGIIQTEGRGKVNTIIIGDWNSVVGQGSEGNVIGQYGLGKRNDRGEMLMQFCQRNNLIVTNTWFKKRKTKLYTWKSPGDLHRYQIDYILVKQRFRGSIKDVKTMPGADIDSDHNLLVADVNTRLKRI